MAMNAKRLLPVLALAVLPLSSGCVVSTATKVATAPVHVAGKAVDMATTSQSEADENRGRAMRKRDEKIRKLQKQYRHHMRQCSEGEDRGCLHARDDHAEIEQLQTGGY